MVTFIIIPGLFWFSDFFCVVSQDQTASAPVLPSSSPLVIIPQVHLAACTFYTPILEATIAQFWRRLILLQVPNSTKQLYDFSKLFCIKGGSKRLNPNSNFRNTLCKLFSQITHASGCCFEASRFYFQKADATCISAWAIHKLSGRFIWAKIHQMALFKHISATDHNSCRLLLTPTCSCFQKPWENSKGPGNYCTCTSWLICTTVSFLHHKFSALMSFHLPSKALKAANTCQCQPV